MKRSKLIITFLYAAGFTVGCNKERKNGFKKAYESSKDGLQQARQWVSDKVAP